MERRDSALNVVKTYDFLSRSAADGVFVWTEKIDDILSEWGSRFGAKMELIDGTVSCQFFSFGFSIPVHYIFLGGRKS